MSPEVVMVLCVWVLASLYLCDGKEYIDLSHDIGKGTPSWPSEEPYTRKTLARGYTSDEYWYQAYHVCISEHTGTHLDAPSHFAEGKWSTDEIPLDHLMGPGVVIDMRHKVAKNPNAELSGIDLKNWLEDNGPLPHGAIVFIRTGWASRYGNKLEYFGTNSNDTSNLVFPGISNGAAQMIVGYEATRGRRVFGVGLDAPSLDYGPSKDFPTHRILLKANIYGLENVANLDKLPTKGFDVLVMHTKLRGGSGSPARILAILPSASDWMSTSVILGTALLATTVLLVLGASYYQQLDDPE